MPKDKSKGEAIRVVQEYKIDQDCLHCRINIVLSEYSWERDIDVYGLSAALIHCFADLLQGAPDEKHRDHLVRWVYDQLGAATGVKAMVCQGATQ